MKVNKWTLLGSMIFCLVLFQNFIPRFSDQAPERRPRIFFLGLADSLWVPLDLGKIEKSDMAFIISEQLKRATKPGVYVLDFGSAKILSEWLKDPIFITQIYNWLKENPVKFALTLPLSNCVDANQVNSELGSILPDGTPINLKYSFFTFDLSSATDLKKCASTLKATVERISEYKKHWNDLSDSSVNVGMLLNDPNQVEAASLGSLLTDALDNVGMDLHYIQKTSDSKISAEVWKDNFLKLKSVYGTSKFGAVVTQTEKIKLGGLDFVQTTSTDLALQPPNVGGKVQINNGHYLSGWLFMNDVVNTAVYIEIFENKESLHKGQKPLATFKFDRPKSCNKVDPCRLDINNLELPISFQHRLKEMVAVVMDQQHLTYTELK